MKLFFEEQKCLRLITCLAAFGSVLFFVNFFWVVNLFCDKYQLFVAVLHQCTVKTGLVARVALAGIDGYLEDETVLVAIDEYLFYFLKMAAFFAFFP